MSKSFSSQITKNPNDAMIVDSFNLAFRYLHSGALKFTDDYLNTVQSLARSYKSGKVVITADSGSSTYRKNIFPEYKQNRKEKQALQTEEEREKFNRFFEEYTKTIETLKDHYPVLQYKGVEADDLAGVLVNRKNKYNLEHIWLISTDEDWDLYVSECVSRFSYVSRKEVRLDNWHERYDYEPEEHLHVKCLMGDSGDNIPGIKGVGPVKAKDLVQKYGTAMDVAAAIPITGKYKYLQSVNEFGANNILRNYQLIDLVSYCEEAVGEDNCKDIDSIMEAL